MGLKFVQKLPDPSEIREQYPLPLELAAIKKNQIGRASCRERV